MGYSFFDSTDPGQQEKLKISYHQCHNKSIWSSVLVPFIFNLFLLFILHNININNTSEFLIIFCP